MPHNGAAGQEHFWRAMFDLLELRGRLTGTGAGAVSSPIHTPPLPTSARARDCAHLLAHYAFTQCLRCRAHLPSHLAMGPVPSTKHLTTHTLHAHSTATTKLPAYHLPRLPAPLLCLCTFTFAPFLPSHSTATHHGSLNSVTLQFTTFSFADCLTCLLTLLTCLHKPLSSSLPEPPSRTHANMAFWQLRLLLVAGNLPHAWGAPASFLQPPFT